MKSPVNIFQLAIDRQSVFDGSVKGAGILGTRNIKLQSDRQSVEFKKGAVQVARNNDLDQLQSFTIEATITPAKVSGEQQVILSAETPGISLHIQPNGKLVGAVHTAGGWKTVTSKTPLKAKAETPVRFTRAANGALRLEVGSEAAVTAKSPGKLQPVGQNGLTIGAAADGKSAHFSGSLTGLNIANGVLPSDFYTQKAQAATKLQQDFIAASGLSRVVVNLMPDASHQRLQPVKDIMNAAGVQRISDLSTLQIKVPTTMTPGKVLVASRKPTTAVNWADIATQFKSADAATRRNLLAQHLTNRNSAATLRDMGATATKPGGVLGESPLKRIDLNLPMRVLRDSPTLRLRLENRRVSDLFRLSGSKLEVVDKDILEELEQSAPSKWPGTNLQWAQVLALNTIPVNSSVIIAGTLDLTNTQLIIEPTVSTLYIIAERVICGPNASIIWRKPGGSTPDRANDPNLNGRGFPGVQTKPGSRDGMDGEDGRPGGPGIDGARGRNAPNLEMWVKSMDAMPNLDLTGEKGIRGGRGQRGGNGGEGGDGQVGRRYWFFGWHCSEDPGDGGDGGDGGRGGRGGSGGNGGNGGRITIGVLEGTLASTVTNQPFKLKNAGEDPGLGGPGGAGGSGGAGGISGAGETCHDAENGRRGAQGQPGSAGPVGLSVGSDGLVEFFEFTEEAWDDLLTRPWLTDVEPAYVFPGDVLTLRGSRFSSNDRVIIDGANLTPTVNADESISVTLPLNTPGGEKSVYVRRQDGAESNRDVLWVKPQLDLLSSTTLIPGSTQTLNGRAFLPGASVLVNGNANPATVVNANRLTFTMPGTGGSGTSGGSVLLQVRNPDGQVSNSRTATIPHILEIPFNFSQHALSFENFTDGVPDWGTYEDTFGAAEVWHEQLDPVFGHPVLTAAYYLFYDYFLKGEANGGLATGFCTSLASLVADRFFQGFNDAPSLTKADHHKYLTAVHGKLLSRESLLHFHDQSRSELARVETTYREIETTFLRGCDRDNMPLLFFIPSGEVWDDGYFDRLGDSHCVMPYRFVYPEGRSPQLSSDGRTTVTDPDQVEMFVWDCNHPSSENCRLVFRRSDGRIHFDYFDDSTSAKFSSTDGITLGMMTLGGYLLADHDLPFSGPFGLTSFIIDFLLSPADLQVTDSNGLRTGNFSGQILSEIAGSHPAYLAKGAYLLPVDTPLTRRVVGNATGSYIYYSIMPDGASLAIEGVSTMAGQEDVLAINNDASQIRITPSVNKTFDITLTRQIDNQVRALAIQGVGGGPTAEIDMTISPELNLMRLGNRGAARTVEVRAFAIDRVDNVPVNKKLANITLPTDHDLAVAVSDWDTVDLNVQTVSFR